MAYATCRSRLFRIDEVSGEELQGIDLPGTKKHEVQMVMNREGTLLYVGTNGWAIGPYSNDLTQKYSMLLPNSKKTVTSVAAGSDSAYYANNGYIFQITDDGNSVAKIPVFGYIEGEIRLAANSKSIGQVFVGSEHKTFAFRQSEHPPSYGPWMSQMASQLGPKMLRQIALPGTHESGTYAFDVWAKKALGYSNFYDTLDTDISLQAKPLRNQILRDWNTTQTLDFTRQLSSGIRYFHLCVDAFKSAGNQYSFNFVHGLVGPSTDQLFGHLAAFLSQPGNDKEVVILDFQRVYWDDDTAHTVFADTILHALGEKLAPKELGADVTLNDLWGTSARVLVFYEYKPTFAEYPFLWPRSKIDSIWAGKSSIDRAMASLDERVPQPSPGHWFGPPYLKSDFFVLQGVIHPDEAMIRRCLAHPQGNPQTLLQCAAQMNVRFVEQIKTWKKKGYTMNILAVDFSN